MIMQCYCIKLSCPLRTTSAGISAITSIDKVTMSKPPQHKHKQTKTSRADGPGINVFPPYLCCQLHRQEPVKSITLWWSQSSKGITAHKKSSDTMRMQVIERYTPGYTGALPHQSLPNPNPDLPWAPPAGRWALAWPMQNLIGVHSGRAGETRIQEIQEAVRRGETWFWTSTP